MLVCTYELCVYLIKKKTVDGAFATYYIHLLRYRLRIGLIRGNESMHRLRLYQI